jgi:hypothetical protein
MTTISDRLFSLTAEMVKADSVDPVFYEFSKTYPDGSRLNALLVGTGGTPNLLLTLTREGREVAREVVGFGSYSPIYINQFVQNSTKESV